MKKVILFLTINSFLSFAALHASADSVIPGASSTNGNTFNQLISVGKTQMQIGAAIEHTLIILLGALAQQFRGMAHGYQG